MEADNALIMLGISKRGKPLITGAEEVCRTRNKGGTIS